MKRRFLKTAALAAALILAISCLCGCGSAIAENIETSPIPAGLTFGDLCGILSIYGHRVQLPCSAEDITALDERIGQDPKYSAQLSYSSNAGASSLYSTDCGEMGSSRYNSIMFTASDEKRKNGLFYINGNIPFGAGMDEIRGLLGEPTEYAQNVRTLKYAFMEGDEVMRIWFGFDEDEELDFLMLLYTKWEKK